MASELPSTSYWIRFFTDAGIPASVAANYAITFSDNRIKLDMLMDLNKDYLREMGITALGDVIAVLKHAVTIYKKVARDKILSTGSPAVPTTDKTESPKRATGTPAARILGHYIRKEVDDSPPSMVYGPKVPPSLANRLGTVAAVKAKKKMLPPEIEEVPVKKVRRVLPEHEGRYKVTLPRGTTQKTQKILQEQGKLQRKSVFDRLGDSNVSSTTEINPASSQKITITGVGSNIVKKKLQKVSVFERLGGKSPISSVSSSTQIDDDGESTGDPLEYHGVFKTPTKTGSAVSSSKSTNHLVAKRAVPGKAIQQRLGTLKKQSKMRAFADEDSDNDDDEDDDDAEYDDGYVDKIILPSKSVASRISLHSKNGRNTKVQRVFKATTSSQGVLASSASFSNKLSSKASSVQERLGMKTKQEASSWNWKNWEDKSESEEELSVPSVMMKKLASKTKRTAIKTEGILADPSNLHKASVRERLGMNMERPSTTGTVKTLKKPVKTTIVKLPGGLSSDQQRVTLPSGKVGILNVTKDGRKIVRIVKSTKSNMGTVTTTQQKKSGVFKRLGV